MKNIVLFYHHCSIEHTSWVGGGGDGGGSGGGGDGGGELITPHHQASLANVPSPRGSFNSCSEVTLKEKDQNQHLLLKFKQVSQNHPIPG